MINNRIKQLRELMKEKGIDIYVVPTSDFHQSEYVGSYFECRQFMSGFTGSAGTLVVSHDEACLWVDGRYFIQAAHELKDSEIKMMKLNVAGYPTISEYINQYKNVTVGFDGRVMSYQSVANIHQNIIGDVDLVNDIWTDRPSMSKEPVYIYDEKYCGQSCKDKLNIIREQMEDATYHLLATLDDIAWIFNIRGHDIMCNPMALAYAIISKDDATLYLQKDAVSKEIKDFFEKENVCIKDYFDIYEDVYTLKGKVLLDRSSVNYRLVSSLESDQIIDKANPSQLLKSIKNEVEIKSTKQAHIYDGIACTKFMYWLKQNLGKVDMDELSLSDKLLEFRKAQPAFTDLSFTTICAYKENGAITHYHATSNNYSKVEPSHLLLIDSGGQYLLGTTDITRTFVLGEVSDIEKRDFTIALKAMFQLQNAHFMKGTTTGMHLDMLARGVFYKYDLDFRHGTGHGVGHFLGVHEGPNSIRPRSLTGFDQPILPGMITTDEPGVYIEGSHGIRHENELLCVEHCTNEFGTFLKFEPITYVPFDISGLDLNYLSKEDIDDINHYQEYVFNIIGQYLSQEEQHWYQENLFIK